MNKKDFSGNPIFEIKGSDGLTRFIPNNLDTIHEYIKAKQDKIEAKAKPKCGAV